MSRLDHPGGLRFTAPAPTALLFAPGSMPERFDKAVNAGADAVILDLEDAVSPPQKLSARRQVADFAARNPSVFVRINARASEWFDADLAALEKVPLGAVMLPKAESLEDIELVFNRLGRKIAVIPLIETARALAGLAQLLSGEGVWFAAFGSLDFALDLGCAHTREALLLTRGELVLRSKLAGRPAPVDGVTTAFADPMQTEADARYAAELGFGGKLAIHPKQIDPIRRAFGDDESVRLWAQRVIDAAPAGGVVQVDGAMVDKPVIDQARRILSKPRR